MSVKLRIFVIILHIIMILTTVLSLSQSINYLPFIIYSISLLNVGMLLSSFKDE